MHAINPSKGATDEPSIDESHGKGAALRLHDDADAR
jgi:hypothetical protein